ncbi:MAG TPA: DNA helicase RecG, partial [Candidatus Paceibacterota bacterium]|nr:DNA helicase RecG [Candidatus Paceibacterota bacterium]
ELAEYDLNIRGSGELYGLRQWGLTDLGMEALKNVKMIEAARKEAQLLISLDPTLANYDFIRAKLDKLHKSLHLE